MKARLKRWGGSLGVVIDASEVQAKRLREGMEIEFDPKPATVRAGDIRGLFHGKLSKAELGKIFRAMDEDDGWRD